MPPGSIRLSDVAARTDVLVIACSRCQRTGRYPLATLIERHGPAFTIPELLRLLSADCPKRRSPTELLWHLDRIDAIRGHGLGLARSANLPSAPLGRL